MPSYEKIRLQKISNKIKMGKITSAFFCVWVVKLVIGKYMKKIEKHYHIELSFYFFCIQYKND